MGLKKNIQLNDICAAVVRNILKMHASPCSEEGADITEMLKAPKIKPCGTPWIRELEEDQRTIQTDMKRTTTK